MDWRGTAIFLAAALGMLGAHAHAQPTPHPTQEKTGGQWAPHRARPSAQSTQSAQSAQRLSAEQREQMRRLEALGYVGGKLPARSQTGVRFHDPAHAYEGLNLYIAGHAREAILMDMDGKRLHAWTAPSIAPEGRHGGETLDGQQVRPVRRDFLGNAYVFDNGDLLAVLGNTGILKLDKDSNVIWQHGNGSHHDFFVNEDGTIHTLTREARVDPAIHPTEPVLLDYITVLDRDGNELRRTSIYHAFANSRFAGYLRLAPRYGDLLHTNTVEVLDGRWAHRSPAFRKGNVLISLKFMSTLAIVDTEHEKVVWAMAGPWHHQHRPTFVEQGRMIVFDNLGGHRQFGRSRLIEFDPLDFDVTWLYEGTPANRLESQANGTCQRLPNGNTLIVESWNGRALEVTREKRIAWEFVNPHRAGPKLQYIAVLFDVVRLDPDFPVGWME